MKLDYELLQSPYPIELSVGNLRKPTINEIWKLTFAKFGYYELLTKLTPKQYFTVLLGEPGKEIWDGMDDEQKDELTTFKIILENEGLRKDYVGMLNFFFEEYVIFAEGMFVLLKSKTDDLGSVTEDMIRGVINEDIFGQVMNLIQQTCCIADKGKQDLSDLKFKNEKARRNYMKILKAQEEQEEKKQKKLNKDLAFPNIISSVCGKHPSYNYLNVGELTIWRLLDAFSRCQTNAIYDIQSARVAAWGDEKKTFDATLWYKNQNED